MTSPFPRAHRLGALLTAPLVVVALGAAAPASAAPKRVVALTPFTANTVANLGKKPVAIGETLGGNDRFAKSLRGVPKLSLTHPNGPNIEKLAAKRPDLVLTGRAWTRGTPAMRRLKMKVATVEPRKVSQIPSQTRKIGRLIGRTSRAKTQAKRIESRIRAATRGIKKRPRVLVVLGIGRTTYAMLENSWGGDVVRRSGGRLLTKGLKAGDGYAQISDETVVARNPDVIIAVPHGNVRDLKKTGRYLKSKPGWRRTKAAKRNRVYVATGNGLLQPYDDVHKTIRDIRKHYLKNR